MTAANVNTTSTRHSEENKFISFHYCYSGTGAILAADNDDLVAALENAIGMQNMYNQNVKLTTSIVNISPTDSLQAQEAVCSLASQGVAAIIGPNHIESSGKMGLQLI